MVNLKTEFQEPLTRPGVKHDEEMSVCSSTPPAHGGYINSSLLENEHLMSETATENGTNMGRIDEITRHQRTYVATQDNKHCSKDVCTDSSLNTGRNSLVH